MEGIKVVKRSKISIRTDCKKIQMEILIISKHPLLIQIGIYVCEKRERQRIRIMITEEMKKTNIKMKSHRLINIRLSEVLDLFRNVQRRTFAANTLPIYFTYGEMRVRRVQHITYPFT